MKSLKGKLLLIINLLVLLSCLILGVVALVFTTFTVGETVQRDLRAMAQQTAHTVKVCIDGEIETLQSIAASEIISNPKNKIQDKVDLLKKEQERINCLSIAFIDEKGNSYRSDGSVEQVQERPFFTKAMNGESDVSDPVYLESEGTVIVFVSTPVKYNDKVVGLLLQRNDGAYLSQLVNGQKFGETGKGYMVNKEGTFIAHTSTDKVADRYNAKNDSNAKGLAEVVDRMLQGEVGTGNYSTDGVVVYSGYAPVEGKDWYVGIGIDKPEVFGRLDLMFKQFSMITLALCAFTAFIAYKAASSISNKVKTASEQLEIVASGDLTNEMPEAQLKSKDEIGQMMRSLTHMQNSIGGIVKTIKQNSNELGDKSHELSDSSSEIAKLSETITQAISEIAEGTSVQSNELIQISSVLSAFNEKLIIMQKQVVMVDGASRKIDSMAEGSSTEMNELNESVTKISQTFETFEKSIANLGKSITEINTITNMITDVANKTNLLALNASIEAARAGEAGKGFAVVAEEIGTLAEQSKQSSSEINQLINHISDETDTLVADALDMGQGLNSQVEIIHRAIESFQGIINEISDVIPKIQSVKESGEGIESDKNLIVEKIDELSSISEEISASSEEISASTDEMNHSINNVADSAKLLSTMTEGMITQVENFKVD